MIQNRIRIEDNYVTLKQFDPRMSEEVLEFDATKMMMMDHESPNYLA